MNQMTFITFVTTNKNSMVLTFNKIEWYTYKSILKENII